MTGSQEDRLAQAWQAYDRGDLHAALTLAEAATVEAPGRWEPIAARVWFLIETGSTDAADALLAPALTAHPIAWPLWWYRGILQQRQGNLAEAAEALRRACIGSAELDEAAFTLAWVLHDLGHYDEALAWSRYAARAADTPGRRRQLAWLLLQTGAADEAATVYETLLALPPDHVSDPTLLICHAATALDQSGAEDRAERCLRDGLAVWPDDPDLLAALGWFLLRHDRPQEAWESTLSLCALAPGRVDGWHLRGLLTSAAGETEAAEAAYATAFRLAPEVADLRLRYAHTLAARGARQEAIALLRPALDRSPDWTDAEDLLLQLLLETEQTTEARSRIHRRLRATPAASDLWRLLAITLDQRDRLETGVQACRRSVRLDPDNVEALRLLGWLAHRTGRTALAAATVRRTLALTGGDPVASIQAAFLFAAATSIGAATLAEAAGAAEAAVARAPSDGEAWRALGHVRLAQNRWADAEAALHTAIAAGTHPLDPHLGLAGLLISRWRIDEAESLLRDILARAPTNRAARGLLLEAYLKVGRWSEGIAVAKNIGDDWPEGQRLQADLLTERGAPGDAEAALALSTRLVQRGVAVLEAGGTLARLVSLGVPGADTALALLHRSDQQAIYVRAIRIAVYRYGNDAFCRLTATAAAAFPDDPWFALADFFARGLRETPAPAMRQAGARRWFRFQRSRIGFAPSPAMPPAQDDKIRIAYLAAYFHGSLLRRVLSAHDPTRFIIYLYTDAALPDGFGATIREPLSGTDLLRSFRANRIDIVIDTVSPHAFEGQDLCVTALTRRLAPVQWAWLGSWGTAGGLYDGLLTDTAAVPADAAALYDEDIIPIEGGQWAWDPPGPGLAPDPGPSPSARNGHITFGVTIRGLRLSTRTLNAWAAILAQVPRARLLVIGFQIGDGAGRQAFADALAKAGIAESRVSYVPPCDYAQLLALYQTIDIALDAIPANGGLSLLDPLWMGVPVVSSAGPWISDRQGLSILTAIGLPDLCGKSDDDFIAIAVSLAGNHERRAELRRDLRGQIAASPLTDGIRVARAIEDAAARYRRPAPATPAETAERAYHRWQARGGRLDFPHPAAPAVSILLPTAASEGLLWESLMALADQDGVSVEVIAPVAIPLPSVTGMRRRKPSGRYHLALSPGLILLPGALAAAVAALDSDSSLAGVTGQVIGADGRLLEAGGMTASDTAPTVFPYAYGEAPLTPETRFRRYGPPPSDRLHLVRPAGAGATLYLPEFLGQSLTEETATSAPWGRPAHPAIRRWAAATGPRLLVIDNAVPLLTAGAGLPRARSILHALTGHAVSLYPLWRPQEDWRAVYQAVPPDIEVILGPGMAGLEAFLDSRRGTYERLLISRPPNLRHIHGLRIRRPDLFDHLPLIYDAEAIFADREIAAAACQGAPLPDGDALIAEEIAWATATARVLTVSDRDADRFRAAGHRDVRCLSHAMPPRRTAPGVAGRHDLLFVGALDPGSPNEDSLLWFAEAILPRLPTVTLTVIGTCRSAKLSALVDERIRFIGSQERLEPFYDASRIFIAPTRFAAGIPVKVIEAAAHGVPVVATSLLVGQLGWSPETEIAAADTADAFADAIIRLLTKDDAWSRQQAAAWDRVATAYDPSRFAAAVRAAITDPMIDSETRPMVTLAARGVASTP